MNKIQAAFIYSINFYMDNIINFSTNQFNNSNNQIPIYKATLSNGSNWSHISNSSSGFESQTESLDIDLDSNSNSNQLFQSQLLVNQPLFLFSNQNNQQNESNQWLDNSMESDIFTVSNASEISLNNSFSVSTVTNSKENDNNSEISKTQMWQFLLELLFDKRCRNIIRWSNPLISFDSSDSIDNEFFIVDPIELARRWSVRSCKPTMTFRKFNRILRYYCKKKILQKIAGKRLTYNFLINIQLYLSQIQHMQQQEQILFFNQMDQSQIYSKNKPFVF